MKESHFAVSMQEDGKMGFFGIVIFAGSRR